MLKIFKTLDSECDKLCQRGDNTSFFRKIPVSQLEKFEMSACIDELKVKAPYLLRLLVKLVSKNDHRNQHKHGKSHHSGICMTIATLLKERSREMNGIQTFLSLVLFTSRVHKQVKYNYIYKLYF